MSELSRRIAVALFALCLGLLLVALVMSHVADRMSAGIPDPRIAYPGKTRAQYSFTLQNETDRLLERAELWTYAPVKQTAAQRCDRIEASHPYELLEDRLGNQVLHFTFKDLPPYGSKIVRIRAELSTSDIPNRIIPGSVEDALRPGRCIESDDPRVVQLARDIRVDPAASRPQAFFRWIAENIRNADYTREDRGALDCLTRRAGDCTEQMYLFIALCRAAGIPARGVGGYVCEGDCVLRPSDYHNWAELLHDGFWRLADPQKRVFMENPSRYIAMRILGASDPQDEHPMGPFHRFRFEGDGLNVRMNQ